VKKPSILVVLLLLSSCSHVTSLTKAKKSRPKSIRSLTSKTTHKEISKKHLDLLASEKIVAKMSAPVRKEVRVEKRQTATASNLPLRFEQRHYDFWLKYFSKKEKARFERHMSNGLKFEKIVHEVFKEHGLPSDLFFVGLIESGFNTHIRSHASAVGPWQFIKGTGKRYGLKIDRYLDERRNIYKSSHAAANYFKDLYNIFGSWELALCAYNAGEYRIINAIRRGNTRDYRQLVKKKLIPKETIFYIPKVAAARHLFKNRRKYGLKPKKADSAFYLNVDKVVAKSSFSLDDVAKKMRIKRSVLRKLNPEVKKSWVGVTKRKPMHLLLPKGKAKRFATLKIAKSSKISRIAKSSSTIRQSVSRSVSSVYRVKSGDSLYRISRKFGLPIKKIKRANRLKTSRIKIGQKLKIPSIGSKYTVKKGDNLTHIARKFKTSIQSIVSANNIRNHKIYKGQNLIILANARQ